jgi:hypothetical protein
MAKKKKYQAASTQSVDKLKQGNSPVFDMLVYTKCSKIPHIIKECEDAERNGSLNNISWDKLIVYNHSKGDKDIKLVKPCGKEKTIEEMLSDL